MIIVRLKGGLGNQLFQYAFARSLSYNLNKELFLDISYFSHSEKRKHVIYGLNSFNIKGIVGNYPYANETCVGIKYLSNAQISKFDEGIKDKIPDTIFDYQIVDKIDNITFPIFFDGYFQLQIDNNSTSYITENFFKSNIDLIHEDLKFKLPLSEEYSYFIEEMKNYDSVALHVRHGDYESIPDMGLCSKEYYQNAIELLEEKLDNPKFFIFSQNHKWVEENLNFKSPFEYVFFEEKINAVGRGISELLRLMSLCNHFIIANSTFSWWGAFLSENKNKIIITPKPWFQDRSYIEVDTIDNVKTINLKNTYQKVYDDLKLTLFKLNSTNFVVENLMCEESDGSFLLKDLNVDSKIILKNIIPTDYDNSAIIKISLQTNSMNCLKLYCNSLNDSSSKIIRSLFYYEGEDITHYLLIPKEALLDNIVIKPFSLDVKCENSLVIKDIEIKEVINSENISFDEVFNENKKLKERLMIINKKYYEYQEKIKKEFIENNNLIFKLKKENVDLERKNSIIEKQFEKQLIEKDEKIVSIKEELLDKIQIYETQKLISKERMQLLLQFFTIRIDIKNEGSRDNDVYVTQISDEDANVVKPLWFKNNKGIGLVINSNKDYIDFTLKCNGNGSLNINLRGMDMRDKNSKRYPVYIDVKKMNINGQEILKSSRLVWHDKPCNYIKKVEDSEIVEIHIEWDVISKNSDFIF